MPFDPVLAEVRFGCGLSPNVTPPDSADALLSGLREADAMAARFPIEPFETFLGRMQAADMLRAERRAARETGSVEAARKAIRLNRQAARKDHYVWMAAHVARRIHTKTGFRERLEWFWADHFTATGKLGVLRHGGSPYMESAIRPNIAGRFEDLLIAAVTHPLMVHYLDQDNSAGPGSDWVQKKPAGRGLNENLAREVLELHTLGAGAPYTQTDVRELAELLTGLTLHPRSGRHFRKDMAEPGAETVLGRSYGGEGAHFRDIEAVLRDLARHPSTARHVAVKLAVHFVSDTPAPELVAAMETAYRASDGALVEVYAAMLAHPAAWRREGGNVKPPFDFITSACRALAVSGEGLGDMKEPEVRLRFLEPLRLMGHLWQKPDGPDGLEEADSAWITPQGMAARLQWAVTIPQLLLPELPDPRAFVPVALGPLATERVAFAARAAESRADGIGLVLASPAFQRM